MKTSIIEVEHFLREIVSSQNICDHKRRALSSSHLSNFYGIFWTANEMNLAVKDFYYYFKYGFDDVRYDAKEFIIECI